jgi:hypothetical protein
VTDTPQPRDARVDEPDQVRTADRPRFEPANFPTHWAVTRTIELLAEGNDPPAVFVRGGHLARVRCDENAKPIIEPFSKPADVHELRTELELRISFGRTVPGRKKDDPPTWKNQHATSDLVQSVRTRGAWPNIPPLEAITEAPTLRADGDIVDEPGYDVASRLLYRPAPGLRVPTVPRQPPRDQVTSAVEQLDDVLCDFPWKTDTARANAFALLLTPLVRPAIAGPVPLALISGTKAGTGKGLFVDVVSRINTGRAPGLVAVPRNDEEMSKVIGALLMAGSTFIAFDEADELHSSNLALALTATTTKPRVLGHSRMIELPQRATWVACGNNIRIRGDLHRRCYWIRLDAQVARPYEREGFRHPNLIAHINERRGELLAAALTIARAWYAANQPPAATPTLGGFQDWAQTIGGILAHAGIIGFLADHAEENRRADEDSTEWEALLTALHALFTGSPFTVGDVLGLIDHNEPTLIEALPDDLAQALHNVSPASARSRLGKALEKRDQTRYGDHGLHLTRAGKATRAGTRWQVTADAEVAQVAQVFDLPTRAPARTHAQGEGGKTSETTAPLHDSPGAQPDPSPAAAAGQHGGLGQHGGPTHRGVVA